jgi:hypothetical protein
VKNKTLLIIAGIVFAFLSTTYSFGQNLNQISTISDNWKATDGLGSKLPSEAETGSSSIFLKS